ncbi:hypothetical protein [Synechocystis sp. LEGE 06083]|uniref:hypothetical protein n=1 Tax=Synechocystis sp. LEGE 06083 TaxID=915336 RepID=UPI001D14DB83|nr:hypothetical protein [Synechocystis sp. LEGE 06083]
MRLFIFSLSLAITLSSSLAMAETVNTTVAIPKPAKNLVLKPNATEGYAQTMREPRAPTAPGPKVDQISPPAITFRGKGIDCSPPSEAFFQQQSSAKVTERN